MRRNRRENRPVVYLDETWANSHSSHERSWVESDDRIQGGTKGGILKPFGKGTRLIILHAGSENGWIDGADLVFQSKKATGDYHDEMNSNNFEEWFHDKLLSNIKDIEKVPTSNTRKSEMQDWLTSHGIEYPEHALKHELLSFY